MEWYSQSYAKKLYKTEERMMNEMKILEGLILIKGH